MGRYCVRRIPTLSNSTHEAASSHRTRDPQKLMNITLGSPEAFHEVKARSQEVGRYKKYLICCCQLGYFIVRPGRGKVVVTFVGFVVYTPSPQEAGTLVDGILAVEQAAKQKPGATRVKATKRNR